MSRKNRVLLREALCAWIASDVFRNAGSSFLEDRPRPTRRQAATDNIFVTCVTDDSITHLRSVDCALLLVRLRWCLHPRRRPNQVRPLQS